jgi:hypothetical protein
MVMVKKISAPVDGIENALVTLSHEFPTTGDAFRVFLFACFGPRQKHENETSAIYRRRNVDLPQVVEGVCISYEEENHEFILFQSAIGG